MNTNAKVKYMMGWGNGYGINRNTGGAKSLPTAVPPYGHVTVKPGTGIVMPGSPKSGYGHIKPAKVISGKK